MFETDEELERELREALRVRDAPAGFAARVVERVDGKHGRKRQPLRLIGLNAPIIKGAFVRWAIAASLLVAVAAGGYSRHERMQRQAGERARQQVLLALRITSATLHSVHDRVLEDKGEAGSK